LYLALREGHRLRAFKSKVLRKTFEPTRDKVTRDWRKLLKEGLYDLYYSPNIVWVIK
jgi:hypothetical protein